MNCIIIEDEIPAQNILKNFISRTLNLELINTYNAAIEANWFLNNNDVDLVFLDINLPDISGLDFIKTIKNTPAIIMTTAYPEYAVSSFELETIVDYLVKPFSFDRFIKAVKKAEGKAKNNSDTIEDTSDETLFLNVDKTLHKIRVKDIIYLESDRNYITLTTVKGKFSFIDALKNWIEKLPSDCFLQVHKSYVINQKFVDKISGNEVFVDGNKIPIGRSFKQNMLKQLKIV